MRAFDQRFADVYNDLERFPNLEAVAQEMGCSIKTVKNRAGEMRALREQSVEGIPELISRIGSGRTVAKPAVEPPQPPQAPEIEFVDRTLVTYRHYDPLPDRTRRFILGSAQDETSAHEPFLDRLEAYAEWLGDTEILVAGFTYNKSVFEDGQGKPTAKRTVPAYFHERVRKYLVHDQVEIGNGLIFCGEMNTLPTAANPLSGFETYTRDKWGVFPHAKQRLQAVATAKRKPTKQLLTTGAVTRENYVQKKAGIVAEFHHVVGVVIVELEPDGTTFARHISTELDGDGTFQDLDVIVSPAGITTGNRIEALNPGDIHHEKLDPIVALSTFGYDVENRQRISTTGTLLAHLAPRYIFIHDLSDFSPRNHHNVKDPHFIFKNFINCTDNVEYELEGCTRFLEAIDGDDREIVVVQSNHDNALLRWLKEADYKTDPINAVFFLETQTNYYRALQEGIEDPPIFEDVLRDFASNGLAGVKFVSEDDSFMVCGIECAMHGHLGANGARGNPRQFTKMGSKSNTGHTHSPYLGDGAAVAGVSGNLDMGYNKGLSSWDQSHIVTYPNGRRCIITMRNGHWFAPRRR
jgi:hypothetical protein